MDRGGVDPPGPEASIRCPQGRSAPRPSPQGRSSGNPPSETPARCPCCGKRTCGNRLCPLPMASGLRPLSNSGASCRGPERASGGPGGSPMPSSPNIAFTRRTRFGGSDSGSSRPVFLCLWALSGYLGKRAVRYCAGIMVIGIVSPFGILITMFDQQPGFFASKACGTNKCERAS